MTTIVFVDPDPDEVPDRLLAALRERGVDVRISSRDELAGALHDADAVVCYRLRAEDVAEATRLRLVQSLAAGTEWIDRDALPPGCVLCNARGHEQAMAEWALGAMIALHRRFARFDRDLRRGIWNRELEEEPHGNFADQTVGILGLGAIGRRVAELVGALGARVVAATRSPEAHDVEAMTVLPLERLGELLPLAAFLVVCLPRTPETEGLVGRDELALLPSPAYLVNVARGPIVEEDALYEALREGRLAGAALDVWYRYPRGDPEPVLPAALPFWELDNVLMTPHVSGRTRRTTELRQQFLAEQLDRFLDGKPLQNVVS